MLTEPECKNAVCPPDKKQARFSDSGGYSLSDTLHPLKAEVRKARPSPLYKSMTYARTNQAVFLWHW